MSSHTKKMTEPGACAFSAETGRIGATYCDLYCLVDNKRSIALLITTSQGSQEGRDREGPEETLIRAWFGSVMVEKDEPRRILYEV